VFLRPPERNAHSLVLLCVGTTQTEILLGRTKDHAILLPMPDEPPELPPWESDGLSSFLASAQSNERIAALSWPDIYALLVKTNAAFALSNEAVENDSSEVLLIPRWLLVRVRSSFLAACRLTMSGQFVEAFPVLRAAIEQAWYAFHIAEDPQSTARAEIWLKRGHSEKDTNKAKEEFSVGRVRRTHEAADAETATQLYWLYKQMIEFGAHPNQLGTFAAMTETNGDSHVQYDIGILHPKPLPVLMTLRLAVAVAIGALKLFERIFPERFAIVGLPDRIAELVQELNTTFRTYIPTEQ